MSEPIRVLHVLARMNRGGAETMVMNLYRSIDRTKVQFDFMVHTDEKCAYDEEIVSLGGRIYRVPRYTGKNHFSYKKIWKAFFETHTEYRIIHGHIRSTAAIYLSLARKYGLTTIAHSHSTSSGYGFPSVIKSILQLPLRYQADYFFACSEESGQWLFGRKNGKKRLNVLKNAINTKDFVYSEELRNAKRQELNLENKYVIGHIGRFTKEKNHTFLIDIFQAVHDRNENAFLLLVGDGDLKQEIQDKADRLGVSDRVIFTGVRADIPALLQAMDVFIFPSLFEGLPVTLVEAQTSGVHCIISDTISREAIITDLIETVSLKTPVEKWADTVLKYDGGYPRADTRDKIIDAGYDVSHSAEWLESFYLGLWETGGPNG